MSPKIPASGNEFDDNVIIMNSGFKALDYLKSKSSPHPDLIFLDINMPGMNGWEFLTEYNTLDKELQSKAIVTLIFYLKLLPNTQRLGIGFLSAFNKLVLRRLKFVVQN